MTTADPHDLPIWTPATGLQLVDESSDFTLFEGLLRVDYAPEEEALALRHIQGIHTALQKLHETHRITSIYVGRFACLVEEYGLWQNLPGCDSFAHFFEGTGWSLGQIRAAMDVVRYVAPVAERVQFPLEEHLADMSGVQTRALREVAKPYRDQEITEEQAATVREEMARIATSRDSDIIAERRARRGEPEHEPYFVRCTLVTSGGKPLLRIASDLTIEDLERMEHKRAYPLYQLNGVSYQLSELVEELHRLGAAKAPGEFA